MFIYLIKNAVTGKSYVGQTRRTLRARFNTHKAVIGKSNACKALSDAMSKHGPENFSIELLRECTSQQDMDFWETKFIEDLGTFSPGGYNLTRGGAGKSGYKHSPESIERTVAAHRGKPLSDAHKAKVSASLIGNHRALGMKHTDETKQRISDLGRGKKRPQFTQSHRAAIADARRGTKASLETRLKMSESHRARNELLRKSDSSTAPLPF